MLLNFRLNYIAVHAKYTELFNDLIDLELHVHARVLDLTDYVEHMLQLINTVDVSAEVLLILVDLINDVLELLG